MKVSDILALDNDVIQKMDEKTLRKTVSTLASAANKRIKRIKEQPDVTSRALIYIEDNGGNFSVKGKNLNQLRSEFKRVTGFLTAKTSTLKGAKEVQKQIEARIGGKLSPSLMKDFWSAYRQLEETDPIFLKNYGSEQMQQFLRQEIVDNPDREVDDLLEVGKKEIDRKYREHMTEVREIEQSLGDYFEM